MSRLILLSVLALAACGSHDPPHPADNPTRGEARERLRSAATPSRAYAPGPGISITRNDDGTETVTYY